MSRVFVDMSSWAKQQSRMRLALLLKLSSRKQLPPFLSHLALDLVLLFLYPIVIAKITKEPTPSAP